MQCFVSLCRATTQDEVKHDEVCSLVLVPGTGVAWFTQDERWVGTGDPGEFSPVRQPLTGCQ